VTKGLLLIRAEVKAAQIFSGSELVTFIVSELSSVQVNRLVVL
jgi:hypothetical protein